MSSLKAAKSRPIEKSISSASLITTVLSNGTAGVVVGEITSRLPDGRISVNYPGNPHGPLPARTLVEDLLAGAKVLLAFEQGLPTLPIVLGIVHDRARVESRTIHVQADRIIFRAKEELTLECGDAGLKAGGNGVLHLKGKDVISRASRANKVRGATVHIN